MNHILYWQQIHGGYTMRALPFDHWGRAVRVARALGHLFIGFRD